MPRVLVTGGSRGLGKAIAQGFAKRGDKVAVTYASRKGDAEAVVETLKRLGAPDAVCIEADVAQEAHVERLAEEILARWEGLDVLINNAGISQDSLLLRLKTEDWDRVLNVNLRGAMLCAREFLKAMMKQRDGVILNISSVIGEMGNAGQSAYAASKAGLIGLTKSLAKEVASRNIRVNAIAPGYFETDMMAAVAESVQNQIKAGIPLGRTGQPEELAGLCVFLSSADARYITGQVVGINGGLYI